MWLSKYNHFTSKHIDKLQYSKLHHNHVDHSKLLMAFCKFNSRVIHLREVARGKINFNVVVSKHISACMRNIHRLKIVVSFVFHNEIRPSWNVMITRLTKLKIKWTLYTISTFIVLEFYYILSHGQRSDIKFNEHSFVCS